MQFSCESCKATLHIGDEKVKGKRLVVRCKKCGARIQIADPALGPPPAGAAALTAAPAAALPVAARPIPTPEKLKPTPRPLQRVEREPEPDPDQGDTDTESTQAMDSGVLEQALRASKADDSTMHDGLPQLSNARVRPGAPPPAPDPQVWFAMIAGKQTGPMSRAELAMKVSQAQVTGRTYLWKETMAGWQRANDVTEVASLFGLPPSRPPPASNTLPPPAPPPTRPGVAREQVMPDMTELRLGDSSLSEEQRRGRQRVQPSFAKKEPKSEPELELQLEDSNISSSSGIEVPLDLAALGEHAPRIASPQKLQPAPTPSPTPTPSNPMHLASSLFPPEREMQRDPLAPAPEADDDDRTHVEPLPLGERVHQEAVAKELFTSSSENSPVGPTAKELASWASKEIGKRPLSQPRIARGPVPSSSGLPRVGTPSSTTLDIAPAAIPGPAADPFDNIPHAPGFVASDAVDTTGNIILRTGVKKSRVGTLVALFGAIIVVLVVLVIALSSGKEPQQASPEAQKKQLGGTGESVDGLVKGSTSGIAAAPGVDGKAQPRKAGTGGTPAQATPTPDAAKPPAPAAPDAQQNAQALASLDTDRVGNHGPKSDATAATPDTAKADSSLSADDIKKKLNENKGALQSCIDEALRKEPNLRVGKIYVATTIAPSGIVTNAKIDKAPVDESPLGACLKRATRRIVFPAFAGDEFEVDIPIVVTAGD